MAARDGLELQKVEKVGSELEIVVTKNALESGTVYVISVLRKKGSLISRQEQDAPTKEGCKAHALMCVPRPIFASHFETSLHR